MHKYKIQAVYNVTETHEFSVDCFGSNFLIIYGRHINGWFIAIPNRNICVEAARPEDYLYNADKLAATGQLAMTEQLARAIREHWEMIGRLEKQGGK